MNDNSAGVQMSGETSLKSIEELIQCKTAIISPEVREYMYLGARPFFRYYQERSKQYLGEHAANTYSLYLRGIEDILDEDENVIHPFLIDVSVKLINNNLTHLFEAFLYTVFIIPMQVVRAMKETSYD